MSRTKALRQFIRPPKYGLRAMFVAVALIAILSGLYGRRLVLMSRENAAARKVLSLGGSVIYRGRYTLQDEGVLTRLVSRLAFDDFDTVSTVGFQGVSIGDADLDVLRSFSRLEDVTLGGTLVTDRCIDTLLELPQLKSVGLWSTQVSDSGFQRLKTNRPTLMIYDGR